jgi:nitrite reductase (NADH) large subunit
MELCMKKTTVAFQVWSPAAATVRTIALIVLLAFIFLFLENKPLPLGAGTVTPLMVFWKMIVPLVPVILLVAPAVWRNICPLALFNMLGYWAKSASLKPEERRERGRLRLSEPGLRGWLINNGTWVGILILCILVPARLFLFNSNALALAILLLALAVLTFTCGLVLPFKSGFSASICPVYPVENLYGMSPFIYLDNTLCHEKAGENRPQTLCGGCIRRCLDLSVGAAAGAKTETQWRPTKTLRLFISSFPGFVLAYWYLDAKQVAGQFPGLVGPLVIYGAFVAAMLISAGAVALIRRLQKADDLVAGKQLDLSLVALAFNLYYWMAIPSWVKTFCLLVGVAETAILPVSGVMLAGILLLTVTWLYRAWATPAAQSK